MHIYLALTRRLQDQRHLRQQCPNLVAPARFPPKKKIRAPYMRAPRIYSFNKIKNKKIKDSHMRCAAQ